MSRPGFCYGIPAFVFVSSARTQVKFATPLPPQKKRKNASRKRERQRERARFRSCSKRSEFPAGWACPEKELDFSLLHEAPVECSWKGPKVRARTAAETIPPACPPGMPLWGSPAAVEVSRWHTAQVVVCQRHGTAHARDTYKQVLWQQGSSTEQRYKLGDTRTGVRDGVNRTR